MSLTRIGSIGINTGIAFAGVTTIVTLNTANDALSIGATVNVGSGITLGASGDIFATGVSTVTTLKVGSGVTVSSDGDIFATGITTVSGNVKVGTGITLSPDGDGFFTGVMTATSYYGDGSNLSNVTSTTINNNADNRLITGSGTANTLEGESNLTFTGTKFTETSSAKDLFYLNSTHSDGPYAAFQSNGTDFAYIGSAKSLFSSASITDLALRTSTNITFGIGANEKLRIDSSGNLGQGTGTPTTPDGSNADNSNNGLVFTMYGDSPAINLIHNTSGGSADSTDHAAINFGRTGSSSNPYRAVIAYKQDDDFLRINANNYITFESGGALGSEKMRLDGSGRLLLGTTVTSSNQSGLLNIFGTNGDDAFLSIRRGSNNASGPRLALCKSRNTTDGAASGLLSDNDILGTIHFYGNDSQGFEEGAAIAASIDGTPGSNDLPTRLTFSTTPDGSDTKQERLRITSSGKVGINNGNPDDTLDVDGTAQITSNVYFGGDIYMYGNSYSGKGIFLGGSGSSNKLDDYEEGTCNPTQVNGSFSPTNNDGKYTKIGRLVTWMISITFDGTASGNHLTIGNFPFTAGGGRPGGAIIRYSNDDEAYEISFHVDAGAATASCYYLNGGGIVQSNAVSDKRFDLTFVYEAA